ncbi:unnamed protein product [Paramecium sonneborni]|uniref:Uncharacterized protein n=1 Tax=Paramecium sonneborni TaxID=65129 RepID=A0A8S1PX15_9CILI|nr:unnamed protein product [Paramecium sonneborni]
MDLFLNEFDEQYQNIQIFEQDQKIQDKGNKISQILYQNIFQINKKSFLQLLNRIAKLQLDYQASKIVQKNKTNLITKKYSQSSSQKFLKIYLNLFSIIIFFEQKFILNCTKFLTNYVFCNKYLKFNKKIPNLKLKNKQQYNFKMNKSQYYQQDQIQKKRKSNSKILKQNLIIDISISVDEDQLNMDLIKEQNYKQEHKSKIRLNQININFNPKTIIKSQKHQKDISSINYT